MEAAGAQLMSWFGVACELHRDWRNDIEGLGTLFSNHLASKKFEERSIGMHHAGGYSSPIEARSLFNWQRLQAVTYE